MNKEVSRLKKKYLIMCLMGCKCGSRDIEFKNNKIKCLGCGGVWYE